MIPKNIIFAYFAGYLDGDGCFFIGHEHSKKRLKQKPIVSIVINSVNKCTLESFKKTFGGSINLAKEAHNNNKALFRYTIKKRNILIIINKICPYLVEKKEECELLIQFANSISFEYQQNCINKMRIIKDIGNLVSKYYKKDFEKVKNTINPTEEDFAYLAGFIDAECSLGISRYKPKNKPNYTYKILLQCNNTKAPVFKWLLERFGGHINFIDRLTSLKARKNQLCWRLSGKALFKILYKIEPFLRYKKPVCNELIKFYKTTLINGGARHTNEFRTQYAEVIRIREEIVTKIHKLNLKGNPNISG
jgi:hypothetical protein